MPVHFTCPQCRQMLKISRRKIGTICECPRCGNPTAVPAPTTTKRELAHSSSSRLESVPSSGISLFDDVNELLAQGPSGRPPWGATPPSTLPKTSPSAGRRPALVATGGASPPASAGRNALLRFASRTRTLPIQGWVVLRRWSAARICCRLSAWPRPTHACSWATSPAVATAFNRRPAAPRSPAPTPPTRPTLLAPNGPWRRADKPVCRCRLHPVLCVELAHQLALVARNACEFA